MSPLRRAVRWCLAPLVDEWSGLSMTRLLAVGGFLLAAESVLREKPIAQGALWFYLAAVAAAFGKSTFTLLLQRTQLTATLQDTRTTTVTHAITERRASADHPDTEPAP